MTASIASKAAALLRKAREHLSNPSKWIKGSIRIRHTDKVCSIGAVHYAAHGFKVVQYLPETARALDILSQAVRPVRNITAFNDSDETTHKDVLETFDRAIEKACEAVRKEAGEDK